MDSIEIGDKVKICFCDESEINGIVLYKPNDIGDLLHIKDERGNIHYLNPSSNNFEQMVKEAREEEKDE